MEFRHPDAPRLLSCDACTFTLACRDIHSAIAQAMRHAVMHEVSPGFSIDLIRGEVNSHESTPAPARAGRGREEGISRVENAHDVRYLRTGDI